MTVLRYWCTSILIWAGLANTCMAEQAPPHCALGGEAAAKSYQRADSLLDHIPPSAAELSEVFLLLQDAIFNKCSEAALKLAYLKAANLRELGGVKRNPTFEAILDEQIYTLLLEATTLDEGWFELGVYLMAADSRYFSPEQALAYLEKAAAKGDKQAIRQLVSLYDKGARGFSVDKSRADYWRLRL